MRVHMYVYACRKEFQSVWGRCEVPSTECFKLHTGCIRREIPQSRKSRTQGYSGSRMHFHGYTRAASLCVGGKARK